jgi:murein DD-endopeptidase MepM/ murein hydrolase activator NlpD
VGLAVPVTAFATVTVLRQPDAVPPPRLVAAPQYDPARVQPPAQRLATADAIPFERTLARGESLAGLLAELGLDGRDRQLISQVLGEHVELRKLRPGMRVAALLGPGERPQSLQLQVPGKGRLVLAAASQGWEGQWQPAVETVELRRVEAVVRSSVAEALEAAGAPLELAYRTADVLRWDVDFTRDLRPGDRLSVLYEQALVDGQPAGVGDVLAAELTNRGQTVEAYRYGDGGYYDGKGYPLRKMFLRSPIAFSTRITSGFSERRFHPILKEFRPHWGIDIGAPIGTPVHVTAEGVVLSAGWDGGGGRTVKVRHPGGYMTGYLHLSAFAKGLSPGARVRQGEVVGFVGESGLATAPHLDYRVQCMGRWLDPMSLKSVPAPPLGRSEMTVFARWREEMRLAMQTGVMPPSASSQWQLAAAPEHVVASASAVIAR